MEATVVLVRDPQTATPKPIRISLKPEKIYIAQDKLTTIVMRKFYSDPQITKLPETKNHDQFYQDADRPVIDHKRLQTDGVTDWPLQRRRQALKKGLVKKTVGIRCRQSIRQIMDSGAGKIASKI